MQIFRAPRDVFLHKRHPKTLGNAAMNLSFHQHRVDCLSNIMGGHELDRFDGA